VENCPCWKRGARAGDTLVAPTRGTVDVVGAIHESPATSRPPPHPRIIAPWAMRLTPRGRPMVAPTTSTADIVGADIIRPVILPKAKSHRRQAITQWKVESGKWRIARVGKGAPRGRPQVAPTTGTVDVVGAIHESPATSRPPPHPRIIALWAMRLAPRPHPALRATFPRGEGYDPPPWGGGTAKRWVRYPQPTNYRLATK